MFTGEQVNTALNMSDTEFLGHNNVSSATTSLGQVTTEHLFSFQDRIAKVVTLSPNNATTNTTESSSHKNATTNTTETSPPEDAVAATTAASAETTAVTAETGANATEMSAFGNSTPSSTIVIKDMDHSHHNSFNASHIDPFSVEVNESRYKYLLTRTLEGIHGK
jgi:hypothetical protein